MSRLTDLIARAKAKDLVLGQEQIKEYFELAIGVPEVDFGKDL